MFLKSNTENFRNQRTGTRSPVSHEGGVTDEKIIFGQTGNTADDNVDTDGLSADTGG
jgi:hypothetical protein